MSFDLGWIAGDRCYIKDGVNFDRVSCSSPGNLVAPTYPRAVDLKIGCDGKLSVKSKLLVLVCVDSEKRNFCVRTHFG